VGSGETILTKGASTAMNAQIHKPEWQRIENWFIWTAVLGAALLVLAPRAADFECVWSADEKEMRPPAAEPAARIEGLPFTARDVAGYFSGSALI